MNRLTMVFAAFLCFAPAALATLSPRNGPPALGREALPTTAKDVPPDIDPPAAVAEDKSEKQNFIINEDTEVTLDDQPCKFQDVPGTASVVSLAVAADKKTILKIHFKSKK